MWATMEARIPPRLFRIEWRRPDACPLTSGLPDAAATCASRQEDPAVPPAAARYMSLDPIRADVMVERLKMPAQPHRLTIGLTSLNGARAVGEIEAVAGIGQPAPSRQPVELHRADLVRPRQEARRIFYKMGSGAIEDPIRPLFTALGAHGPDRNMSMPAVSIAHSRAFVGAAASAHIG